MSKAMDFYPLQKTLENLWQKHDKYGQKIFDATNKSATDVLKTNSKESNPKNSRSNS